MGRKNTKGSVSLIKDGNRIRLRWRYNSKRYSINLDTYNKVNIANAKKLMIAIELDLANETFDTTLRKYKKHNTLQDNDLISCFEYWTENYKQMNCNVHKNYYTIRAMLKRFENPNENNILVQFNQQKINYTSFNRRLSMLKDFGNWMKRSNYWKLNPFEEVRKRKGKKTRNTNRDPFSEEEIKQILAALKNDTYKKPKSPFSHSLYYPFVYFTFKTGVRNAEAVGLRVDHIDIKNKLINIKEVLARPLIGSHAEVRIRKETKNGKERVLPLTDDLLEIIAPLLTNKKGDDLVFQSCTGKAIDDRMFQRRVFKPVLKALNIPDRVLYAARHTFGSRCLDMGMPPVQVSFMMGNNPETLLRTYTHQITLPKELPSL